MRRASHIVRSDLAMLMVMGFVAMVIFMLPWLNPPTQHEDLLPPGNLIILIHWPPGPIDVDLWVTGPGEHHPVGYSNQSGKVFNLLRDDLGQPDPEMNFENAYSRGIPEGEYVINIHCYNCSFTLPLRVTVDVKMKRHGSKKAINIFNTDVILNQNNEEKTVARFFIDDKQNFIRDSLHNSPISLRTAYR